MSRFQIRLDVTETEAKELVSSFRSFGIGGGKTLGDLLADALKASEDPSGGGKSLSFRSSASKALEPDLSSASRLD